MYTERPNSLTILCVLNFLAAPVLAAILVFVHVLAYMLSGTGTGGALVWPWVSILISLIAVVGIFRMKKWGMNLYTANCAIWLVIMLFTAHFYLGEVLKIWWVWIIPLLTILATQVHKTEME